MDRFGSKLLSCEDLFLARTEKCSKPLYEPKKNSNSKVPEENAYLQEKYQEMEKVLGQQRVTKCNWSSVAEYSEERIIVTKKSGNWNKFGYTQQRVNYVAPHEALFLVEMKRLIIFRNSVVMSVEECYESFLTSDEGCNQNPQLLTLTQYLVYALLSRNGYIVRRHEDRPKQAESREVDEENLIWTHLQDLLANRGQTSSVPQSIIEDMKQHRHAIESQSTSKPEIFVEDVESEWLTTKIVPKISSPELKKRKAEVSNDWSAKRFKASGETRALEVLKDDPEYKQIRDCFESLEVIGINAQPVEPGFESPFQFHFDVRDPKFGLKKDSLPIYRGIVCVPGTSPSYKDLRYLYQSQSDHVPILVFHVDSMIVNCFLYEVSV